MDLPLDSKTYGQLTPPTGTNIQLHTCPPKDILHAHVCRWLVCGVAFSCSYTHGNGIKNLEYSPLYHIWRLIN